MTIMHLDIDIELRVRVFEMLLQLHVCYFPFKTLSWYPRCIIFAGRFNRYVPNRFAECITHCRLNDGLWIMIPLLSKSRSRKLLCGVLESSGSFEDIASPSLVQSKQLAA